MYTSAALEEQEVLEPSRLKQMVRLSSFHPLKASTKTIPSPLSVAESGSEKSHAQSIMESRAHSSDGKRKDMQKR